MAGILDVIPMSQMLKRVPGGRKQVIQVLVSAATESGTETAQEQFSIGAERLLEIDDPGSEAERKLAAASLGLLAGGTVSAITTSALRTEAVDEVNEGPLAEALGSLDESQQAQLRSAITITEAEAPDTTARAEAVTRQLAEAPPEESATVAPEETIEKAASEKQLTGAQVSRRGIADGGLFTTPLRTVSEATSQAGNFAVRDMIDRVRRMGGPEAAQVA